MSDVMMMHNIPVEDQSTKKIKSPKDPYAWIKILSILFGCISAIISGVGAFQLLQNIMGGLEAAIAAATFTIIVQISIVALVFAVVKKLPAILKILILSGLLIMWFFSITAAAGSVWYFLRASDFASDVNQHRLSTITSPLGTAGNQLLKVRQSMDAVAALASKRAAREDNFGDSCGYSAGTGKGSRFILRNAHNAEAKKYSKVASNQHSKIQSVIAQSSKASKVDGKVLSTAYSEANHILQGGSFQEIKDWATKTAKGYSSVFPRAKTDGSDLTCIDDEMANKLLTAVVAIDFIPQLPGIPPREKTVSMSESLLLSYKRMLLPFFQTNPDSATPSGADPLDYITLIPPTVIEFMILLFALIHEILRRKAGIGNDELTDYLNMRGSITPADFFKIENFITGKGKAFSLFDLYERLAMPYSNDNYFVLPLGGKKEVAHQARRLVQHLRLNQGTNGKYPVHGIDVEKLPEWFKNYNSDLLEGVKSVHVYPVSASTQNWIRDRTRDYSNTMVLDAS